MVLPVSIPTLVGAVAHLPTFGAMTEFLRRFGVISPLPFVKSDTVFWSSAKFAFLHKSGIIFVRKSLSHLLRLFLKLLRVFRLFYVRWKIRGKRRRTRNQLNVFEILLGFLRNFVDEEDGASARLQSVIFKFDLSFDVGFNVKQTNFGADARVDDGNTRVFSRNSDRINVNNTLTERNLSLGIKNAED